MACCGRRPRPAGKSGGEDRWCFQVLIGGCLEEEDIQEASRIESTQLVQGYQKTGLSCVTNNDTGTWPCDQEKNKVMIIRTLQSRPVICNVVRREKPRLLALSTMKQPRGDHQPRPRPRATSSIAPVTDCLPERRLNLTSGLARTAKVRQGVKGFSVELGGRGWADGARCCWGGAEVRAVDEDSGLARME